MADDRNRKGTLYLVATPVGNLEDISLRAVRVLKSVHLIACEDTRHTVRLLRRYGITTPRESHHKFNEAARATRLVSLLLEGKDLALVSDSGSPLISDPGYSLVTACHRAGCPVTPVPGASAAVAALTASGLPTDCFLFAGFLPHRKGERRRRLQEIAGTPATLVLYEAPHRLTASLEDMVEILGAREACLAREISKIHEEWLRGTLREILADIRARPAIRGEITLVVARGTPACRDAKPSWPDSIREHLEAEMQRTGASRKEALKSVARQRGLSRRDAYRALLGV